MYVEPAEVTFVRNFNRMLKKWKAEGHTYRELMSRAGLSYTVFYNYRVGRRTPSLQSISRMAEVFNIPTEMFFRR